LSGDVDEVAGMGSGAQHRFTSRQLSCNYDVCGDLRCGRGVSACELYAILFGESDKAFKEIIGPVLRQVGRQTEREKAGDGLATHGGNITETASEAAVANAAGGMPLAAKMNVFDGKVGGEEEFVPGREAEYGTIVADSLRYGAVWAFGGETANALNQLLFTGNQGELNYIEKKGLAAEKARFHLSPGQASGGVGNAAV
jgi:hypothetical protein